MPLKVLAESVPYTIGTVYGQGWIVYYDGEHQVKVPEELIDRPVTNIYRREGREEMADCCELKAGLAIIVEGTENGEI
jgi:hypothetical protein